MRIQWDAALVAATGQALDRRFRRARIRAFLLDPVSRRLVIYLRGATLAWDLHPERLGFRVLEPVEPPQEARRLPAKVERIWSPPDDRLLVLEYRRVRGRPPRGSIILELFPNQENVVLTEGEEATVRALLRTREGERTVRRGQPYVFPPPSDREGIADDPGPERWNQVLDGLEGRDARGALLRTFAWTSSLLAPSLLRPGGFELWRTVRQRAVGPAEMATDPPPLPGWVVQGRHGPQPCPVPLEDRVLEEADDLLDAFGRTDALSEIQVPTLIPGARMEALKARVERARGRVASLEEELQGLGDPEELQRWGDLILARFDQVPEGRESVTLQGFQGETVDVPLDPKLSADANARRHYDRAGRVRRAREALPGRIREAREEWKKLEDLVERVRLDEASREEVEAVLPDESSGGEAGDGGPSLPYRRYRSTGGLEIRVGRGAARNDDLTFRHSRPDDIWLHARHTAGAHVILRWAEDDAPPARDLAEAATLAALNSRARTSGSVPVDWTRRKYVRKPRKAPPGAVLPERVKTLFVSPNPAVAEQLREE